MAQDLRNKISSNDQWTIRGFIDTFQNIYPLSTDTKLVSKVLELHLFPYFVEFAERYNYQLEPAEHQNWYPDLSFISKDDSNIKFAVDLKTSYRKDESLCNGFTLGSHGEYFVNRQSTKNIQHPYSEYLAHICFGVIYNRKRTDKAQELQIYNLDTLDNIVPVLGSFQFFVQEKWKIASDKAGSGNTANIGSIKNIQQLMQGKGVFAPYGESIFDDYWCNYRKIYTVGRDGQSRVITSLNQYLRYRGIEPKA